MKLTRILLMTILILFLSAWTWAATETFYMCNGGDGSAPEVNACAGAFDEGDINTSSNWDTDDQNDGKIGPNDDIIVNTDFDKKVEHSLQK